MKFALSALRQPDAARNPFVTTVFAGAYADGEEGLPLYLQHASQVLLRNLGIRDRLRLHAGNMIELMAPLAERHGPFDLISISNITDWMNDEQFRGVVRAAIPCLRPGGALLARAANSAAPIRGVIASEMQLLPDLDAALPAIERGPWFRTLAVGLR